MSLEDMLKIVESKYGEKCKFGVSGADNFIAIDATIKKATIVKDMILVSFSDVPLVVNAWVLQQEIDGVFKPIIDIPISTD